MGQRRLLKPNVRWVAAEGEGHVEEIMWRGTCSSCHAGMRHQPPMCRASDTSPLHLAVLLVQPDALLATRWVH